MDINIFSSTQEQKEKNSKVNERECHIFILTRAILPLSLHYKQKLRNKNKNYMTLVQQILQKKKKNRIWPRFKISRLHCTYILYSHQCNKIKILCGTSSRCFNTSISKKLFIFPVLLTF